MTTQAALALLDELLDLPAADQARRLERIAQDDPANARLLERWLAADRTPGAWTTRPARYAALLDDLESERDAMDAGRTVGAWRLTRELGRGGMGAVWLAERVEGGFTQRAALKLIKRGMDSDAVQRRFLAERQILAPLAHPNIARLLDGGVAEDGRPYFALEYVDGVPLLQFVQQRNLDLRARLQLFVKLCAAVAYAHARLVVHRDLKPSNVLVQSDGEPKLIDFGIAKVLGDGDRDSAASTVQGQRFFTPAYAAPEQLAGEPVSTATDTYALGLVLYELLTGVRVADTAGFTAMRSTDRPSAARVRAGATGPTPIRPQQLKGDLDTIVLRALAPEPARRYVGAQAVADDIARYLAGRPVRARPDSAGYRAGKFIQRHRAAVAASVLALVALLTATGVSLQQARIAREHAARAQQEATTAQAVKAFLLDAFTSADPYKTEGRQVSARELLEAGADKIDTALANQPLVRAELHEAFGDTFTKLDQNEMADAQYQKALEAYRSGGAGDTPRAIWVEVGRLNTHFEASQLDGLEQQLRAVLAQIGDRRGDFLEPRSDALTVLALTLSTQGRYADAAVTGEELVALLLHERGENDRATAFAIYALSLVRFEQGQLAPAAALVERYVNADVKTLGPDSPGLVTDLQTIARVLGDTGHADRALPIIMAAVDARMRHFGADHRLTASAWARLAGIESLLGRGDAANAHYRQALASMEQGIGAQHDKVALMRLEFARFLIERDALDEARAQVLASDPVWLRLGGPEHPRHRACTATLAEIDARQGNAGAVARLQAIAREQGAAGDADLPHSLEVLGELALAGGRRDQARLSFEQAEHALQAQQRGGSQSAQRVHARLVELGVSNNMSAAPATEIEAIATRLDAIAKGIIQRAGDSGRK